MYTRTGKLALTAAVIMSVLSGITFWPAGNGKWWLEPPAAWGRELLRSLDEIEAVVYRQRVGRASDFGLPEMSVGWEQRYNAKDRYRRDRYDDGVNIMNTQWVFRDGNDLRMVEVSYEYECYFERENEAYGFVEDPVEWLRSYVQLLDRADRLLDTQVFDGRECVGFEVGAARYGDNPKGRIDRIWFDVETKLPARIERHGLDSGFDAARTMITIHDQFQYYAQVPVNLFLPVVPPDYVNAHPDDVRAARDKHVKGEMTYAQVPEHFREQVIAALKSITTGSYRRSGDRVSFTHGAWRTDRPYGSEQPSQTQWYVVTGTRPEGPFEANGDLAVTETTVDFPAQSFRVIDHAASSSPSHPMVKILFVAGLIDKADRFYESAEIDGVKCFGFEISAKKYGDNPEGMIDRVWFDAATSLPVRIEFEYAPGDAAETRSVRVTDCFEWDLELPEDFLVPRIPPGFAADGLWEKIAAAMDKVKMGSYQIVDEHHPEGSQVQCFSRNAWRTDYHRDGSPVLVRWHVADRELPWETPTPPDDGTVTSTMVDFEHGTYQTVTYAGPSQPRHPMASLRSFANCIRRPDRFYESAEIDGVACFGFEIGANKYGDNPDGFSHRMWFDARTYLPVRLEWHGPARDAGGASTTLIQSQEQFDWAPGLPEDFFTPQVPPGFQEAAGAPGD